METSLSFWGKKKKFTSARLLCHTMNYADIFIFFLRNVPYTSSSTHACLLLTKMMSLVDIYIHIGRLSFYLFQVRDSLGGSHRDSPGTIMTVSPEVTTKCATGSVTVMVPCLLLVVLVLAPV